MRILLIGLILALFTVAGCGKKTDEPIFTEDKPDTTATAEETPISKEVIGDILQQIPSPLEISVLLKESGKTYNPAFLNSADNASKYNTNYKKALNLGIYGTDLGYTNIYEQSKDGAKYMTSIKGLADGLSIGQFFDIETIARLATNSKNLDSLLLITTQNFNTINSYLQTQDRANLSVLFLTGGWLEALHITCGVASANPGNQQLKETIGEQKIILENIMLLL
jgi:predicted small lipoprotein YifL